MSKFGVEFVFNETRYILEKVMAAFMSVSSTQLKFDMFFTIIMKFT